MMSSSGAAPLTWMAVKEKEAERLKKIQFVCDRCGAVLEKTAIKIIPNVVELEGGRHPASGGRSHTWDALLCSVYGCPPEVPAP